MTDITDRRRAIAAAVVLARAELALGLPMAPDVGLQARCGRILAAARLGRLAWPIWRRTHG